MDLTLVNKSITELMKNINFNNGYINDYYVNESFVTSFTNSKKLIKEFLSKQSEFSDINISDIAFETSSYLLLNKINLIQEVMDSYGYYDIFNLYNKNNISLEQMMNYKSDNFDLGNSLKTFIKNDLSNVRHTKLINLIKDLYSIISKNKKNIEESNENYSKIKLSFSINLIDFLGMGHYGVDKNSCFNFLTGSRYHNKYNIAMMDNSFMVILKNDNEVIARCIGVMESENRWDFFNWYGKKEADIIKLFKCLLFSIGVLADEDMLYYSYDKFNFEDGVHAGSTKFIYINKNTFSISTKEIIPEYLPDLNIDCGIIV